MQKTFYVRTDRGFDAYGWLGTRLITVEAETKEEATRLISLQTGEEVIRAQTYD